MSDLAGPLPTFDDLPEEQRREALAIAEAARRAEARAEKRAREGETLRSSKISPTPSDDKASIGKVVFVSKKRRGELAKEREIEDKKRRTAASSSNNKSASNKKASKTNASKHSENKKNRSSSRQSSSCHLTPVQITALKKSYLGSSSTSTDQSSDLRSIKKQLEIQKRQRAQKKITFKFAWDDSEDTSRDVFEDAVQSNKIPAGVLLRNKPDASRHRSKNSSSSNPTMMMRGDHIATVESVSVKPLHQMTSRDWRIFRENYDIIVRGGRAPPPMRTFRESPLPTIPTVHPSLLRAIERTLLYKSPSPIQMQAIPIGLQRRDLIGVAETGSGKTIAFGVPLCHRILSMPQEVLDGVADDGPLALVMAPTRELALQIHLVLQKLLTHAEHVKVLAVVGGQSIEAQASNLRQGVHIVIGTPGRINDCVEMAYLVLNQCTYIVLDEADRMIDLGFAPQMDLILDAMGGLLKSADEKEAYEQEKGDLGVVGVPTYRLTAMFSATMPGEVERIAKRYLRHPAIVAIGDQDSGKNTRIHQKIIFLSSPGQKEGALRGILAGMRENDKYIVFVNEKKHADGVGRMVENAGRRCVVLHGGKTQEQREENLDIFKRNVAPVLVATDVAGRGLDITDVSHVINFDMPSRSIDNYCHRIGRTGRAGKVGFATSFITDADEGIMAPLVQYLEVTGSAVPDRLKRHPAAASSTHAGIIS